MKPEIRTIFAAVIWVLAISNPCHATVDETRDAPAGRSVADQAGCRDVFNRLDKSVDSAGIRDNQDTRIPDFPHYRVDRFLASFAGELSSDAAIMEWLGRLVRLGNDGRRAELANLPGSASPDLPADFGSTDLPAGMEQCAERLMAEDLVDPERITRIRESAVVPDDYSTPVRAVGVNPVSRWIVMRELGALNEKARNDFQQPGALGGSRILLYVPNRPRPAITKEQRAAILGQARGKSALGIPEPDPQSLAQLFDYYAPAWRIGTDDDCDRIGRPFWREDDRIGVDAADPVVYRWHSFTRLRDHVLLQLNYLAWFSERPSQGMLDIYSGRLDGLVWRVTLDPEGGVLLYDSVHPCGCYHKYYPVSPRLRPLDAPSTPEPPLILTREIPETENGRVVIHVSSREHYVVGLSTGTAQPGEPGVSGVAGGPGNRVVYRFEDDAALRSMPYRDGRRSMFGPDGLVKGTERGERWLTWPMGVSSAGAMRQRGHYPLSLIGREHFDDARLLENVFTFSER